MPEIVIDQEFKALIPPLSAEELAQLEANIVADGCRDPLVVWGTTLIDGHNRYDICTRHSITFQTVQMEFESKAHARIWIRRTQAGRRNLPDAWKIELELANKDELAAIGRAKHAANGGDKKSEKAKNGVINNDKGDPSEANNKTEPTAAPEPQSKPEKHNTQKEIAKAAGVSTGKVAQAEIIRREAPELWEQAKAQEIPIGTAYRQVKRAAKEKKREWRREENRIKIAKSATTPQSIIEVGAKFATIMIDPPWDWGDEGDKDQLGRARPDYSTMSIDELLALPVPDLADVDCHMYMWITNRSLPKGFALLEKWGFRYITAITWVKPHFGMGNYFRGQSEHVLFGVKGSQPLQRKDVGTVFQAPRGPSGHSSKPPEFYGLVESCSPGPYLEMFSRSQRAGWATWGENGHAE